MQDSISRQQAVRDGIEKLRNAYDAALASLNEDSIHRRLDCFHQNKSSFDLLRGDPLDCAYRMVPHLRRGGAHCAQNEQADHLHSQSFCHTLEACKILELDTRTVCKRHNKDTTGRLIQQIDPRLHFSRNYELLRPYASCCEEMISIRD